MKNNIILVGNGSSIIDKPRGKKIDSFDNVVRFNNFRLPDKLKEFTGKKTDIWFTCSTYHIDKINSYKKIIVHSWDSNENNCMIYSKIKKYRSDAIKIKKKLIDKVPCKDPSTGLIAIYYFLDHFNIITLLGFDWWERNTHHYADNEIRGNLHDPEREFLVIKKLSMQKRVKFLY
jgi:hypothetical protein